MSKVAKQLLNPSSVLFVAPLALALAGCGGGGGGDSASAASADSPATPGGNTVEERIVSGGAIKGVVRDGKVRAYEIEMSPTGKLVAGEPLGRVVETDQDGQFELAVDAGVSGWVLVELTADSDTRMVCDVVPACQVAGLDAPVPFGETFAVDEDFSLRGAVDVSAADEVFLTPLSDLAVTLAESDSRGLDGTVIAGSYEKVEQWFGLEAGTLQLAPPDLTRLNEFDATVSQIQMAVVNAAFLGVATGDQPGSITATLREAREQVAQTGSLAASGTEGLTMDSLFMAQALLASDLQQKVRDSLAQQALAVTKQRAADLFEDSLVAGPAPEETQEPETGSEGSQVVENGGETETGGESATGTQDPLVTDNTGSETGNTVESGTGEDPVTNEEPSQEGGNTVANEETTEPEPDPLATAARLTWNAPLTRENGESLAMGELDGYVILYGQDPQSLGQTITVPDAATMSWTVENLDPGTWYFAIKVRDVQGNESKLSEVVSKTI